jgi:hypothetical protein
LCTRRPSRSLHRDRIGLNTDVSKLKVDLDGNVRDRRNDQIGFDQKRRDFEIDDLDGAIHRTLTVYCRSRPA